MKKLSFLIFFALPLMGALPVQVAASLGGSCILGLITKADTHGTGVECWNAEGTPEQVPPLINPTQVVRGVRLGAIYGDYACALTQQGLRCWGKQGEKVQKYFSSYTQPYLIVAGPSDVCISDYDKGIACFGGEIRWTGIGNGPQRIKYARLLSVGPYYACALNYAGYVECWGGVQKTLSDNLDENERARVATIGKKLLEVPGPFPKAETLTLGAGHACILNEGLPLCWGADFSQETAVKWSQPGQGYNLEASAYKTCWLEKTKLQCIGQIEKRFSTLVSQIDFAPLVFASNKETYAPYQRECLLSDTGLHCLGKQKTTMKASLIGYSIHSLENEVERMAKYTYSSKADYFVNVAKLLRTTFKDTAHYGEESKVRLFTMNVLKIFIDSVKTEYFKENVVPTYDFLLGFYNQAQGMTSLKTFGNSKEMQRVAIRLLEVSARNLGQQRIPMSNPKLWEEMMHSLGKAITFGTEESIKELVTALDALDETFSEIGAHASWSGSVSTVRALAAYLKETGV